MKYKVKCGNCKWLLFTKATTETEIEAYYVIKSLSMKYKYGRLFRSSGYILTWNNFHKDVSRVKESVIV